ncbi:MAG: leucyl/phenylalanyl-tRNA--protein transferase [Myxococcota bacterium]
MVAILNRSLEFPEPTSANRDGLVAVGGDLSVERLLLGYRSGIFPWPIFDDDLMTWFSPDPRAVLEFDELYVSRSLRKKLKRFHMTVDVCFDRVVAGCAAPAPDRPSTWITTELARAYLELHRRGHAHSVETWLDGKLVGGLYGVAVQGLFAGESMFSRVADASKAALVELVQRLVRGGFTLLDIQQATPHMVRMGAREISRRAYLDRLQFALTQETCFPVD